MVAYRDCKGHLVCMADAQTGIVEIQHKDRAVRMTVPVGDSFTVTLRDTETVMTRISTRSFHVKSRLVFRPIGFLHITGRTSIK